MLIDVEGHEEKLLRGGSALLSDPARRPTMIEVHPYAWTELVWVPIDQWELERVSVMMQTLKEKVMRKLRMR